MRDGWPTMPVQVPGVSCRLDLVPVISVYVSGVTGEGCGCVSMTLDGQLLVKVRPDREDTFPGLWVISDPDGQILHNFNSELNKLRHLNVTQTPTLSGTPDSY